MSQPGAPRADQQHGDATGDGGAERSAEAIAEEWAGRVARWTLRNLARAREEAEDIWADAQALRREL